MVREELIKRSPLRILEKSIHGGLGKGKLGVIASRQGIGKTACLVHMATDKLFRNEQVIHVSFSRNVGHVISWYEDIFTEISKKQDLENAMNVHDEVIKHRVIMNFSQENVSVGQILNSLKAMIKDGGFKADAVFFDGYKMTVSEEADLDQIKAFAAEMNIEVWFSVSPVKQDVEVDQYGVPETMSKFVNKLDVLIGLKYQDDHVMMTVVRDHGSTEPVKIALKLDPKTMLISEE
ncbi:MAG: hypothetical protein KAQ69_01250 [Spirochaetales bacterium]|nr:hypothetical protein [Spirochaetales bacterium]